MNVPALKIKCPECGTEDKIKIPVILTGKDAGVLIVCEKCNYLLCEFVNDVSD